MKFKQKQKVTTENPKMGIPQEKVITEQELMDIVKGFETQLGEAQTRVVMLQGAIQASRQMLKFPEKPIDKNGTEK